LFEAENNAGYMYGFTENYIKVKTPYDPLLVNEIQRVKLTGMNEEGLMMSQADLADQLPEHLKKKLVKTAS
jgi:penicillin V acylase-like amidase (Ntn superfamily)